ncbi:MAG: MMPL family transporter [Myxococcales bacterium]|nr:MMPL family transporter [Myxococcales bacterium]
MSLPAKAAGAYARLVVRRPALMLLVLVALGIGSGFASSKLTINSNQLDLISQDLREVKDVKRIVDMVGGTGYLILALRSDDEQRMKKVAEDLNQKLVAREDVNFITYKIPVEFIQNNMVLFIKTEDLLEGKRRIMAYLKDQLRRNNPFFIEIRKTEPVKLELNDLLEKYSRIGKKSIRDDYNISEDKKLLLLLIKPRWNAPELDRTRRFVEDLRATLEGYSAHNPHGATLEESYDPTPPPSGRIAFGFTGSYKLMVDDSDAVIRSLRPTTLVSFLGILAITIAFFRKPSPILIIASGMVLGTLLTMGFTYVTVGQLNMITSMLAGIMMGLGVDFGFHFTYRTRLELGQGKPYDEAIVAAISNAGSAAFISAVATSGSFFALLVSEFRGFSQFGLLAGFGTFLIGLTLFSWPPAILALLGRARPDLPAKLIGTSAPPRRNDESGRERRMPNPKLVIAVFGALVLVLCAFAIPFGEVEESSRKLTLLERLKSGVRFDYNTRALMPEDQYSVILNDEIARRFDISADPIAVYTRTLEEAKEVFDELTPLDPERFSSVDQVVSVYSFVPPAQTAGANLAVLEEWKKELADIDVKSLPPELQDKAERFLGMLDAKPFDVHGVPEVYAKMFRNLPTTRPENHGYLTFIYPAVDLWHGKNMLRFSDQTETIVTKAGNTFHSAGLPILYAKLARIVLFDGKVTVALTAVWILLVLLLDFRSVYPTLASLLPLGLGVGMLLGVMSLFDLRLNFMNIVVLPIVLGYGVSHGVYLVHRFNEGASPVVALRSVGSAVAASTLTTVAGFGALLWASHNGLKSMGLVACIGLITTLLVSFTLLGSVLQLLHDRRTGRGSPDAAANGQQDAA